MPRTCRVPDPGRGGDTREVVVADGTTGDEYPSVGADGGRVPVAAAAASVPPWSPSAPGRSRRSAWSPPSRACRRPVASAPPPQRKILPGAYITSLEVTPSCRPQHPAGKRAAAAGRARRSTWRVGDAEHPAVRGHPVARVPPVQPRRVGGGEQPEAAGERAELRPRRTAAATLDVGLAVRHRGQGGVPARPVHRRRPEVSRSVSPSRTG